MRFVVVDVMNMKRASFAAVLAAVPACLVIPAPNLLPERATELRRVSNIETLSAAPNQMDAGGAIDPAISALDQTAGFADRVAASSTGNGDGVVVPVVFAAPPSGAGRPLTFTFPIAEVMLHLFEMPAWALKRCTAIFAGDSAPVIGLKPGLVFRNEPARPASLVELFEVLAASAGA